MPLTSFRYREWDDDAREWVLEGITFRGVDLFVGKNASGKSRILTIINSFSRLITKEQPQPFSSGTFHLDFLFDGKLYSYSLRCLNGAIYSESLSIDGQLFLERDNEGIGWLHAEKFDARLDFKVPPGDMVLVTRRDSIQHAYLEPMHTWANGLRLIHFGSELGKSTVLAMPGTRDGTEEVKPVANATDPAEVARFFEVGIRQFGEDFRESIKSDLIHVGYDCENVGIDEFRDVQIKGLIPLMLYVKERGIECPIRQIEMSQGMYRALALIIHLNYAAYSKTTSTLLVDDIGEGLDFQRSVSLINLLVDRCRHAEIQLAMSTNDRFVMNEVDLSMWQIVDRQANHVRTINNQNSPDIFNEFIFTGLSNFDFFSSSAYKGTSAENIE